MGPIWNFNFVLEKLCGEYFVLFAVDDKHEKTFLEKNKEVTTSISNVECFGMNLKKINKEGFFQKIKNKVKYRFDKKTKFIQVFPSYGTLEKRATTYLHMDRSNGTYLTFSDIIQIISNRDRKKK